LRARGNVEVAAAWRNGRAITGSLRAGVAGAFRIRPPRGQRIAKITAGDKTIEAVASDGVWLVHLDPSQIYVLTFE
jgi:hypothetical protein